MRGCASSGTRPARSRAPTISAPSSRSAFAARRCRRSRRCRTSGCARGRGAATSGTEIRVNAGIIESVVEAGGPEGTMVEVADVFYNLPARRKFLKSDAAEAAQVSRFVTQLALCYPEVGFTLTSSGRKVIAVPPVASLADRLYQLYGDRQDLVPVDREFGGLRLHGFIAALAEQGPVRGPQHVFVNRRIVKDRTIAHAILDAYSVATNKERSPEVHLFLEVPPDRVDVNVHPTKAEVRFREQSHGPRDRPPRARRCARQGPGAGADAATRRTCCRAGRCSRRFPARCAAAVSRAAGRRRSPAGPTSVRTAVPDRPRPAPPSDRTRRTSVSRRSRPAVRPDDRPRPVPRHLHHRHGRRRALHHRSARRARARAVRADHAAADRASRSRASGCWCRWCWSCRRPSGRRWCREAEALARFGFEVEEFGGDSIKVTAMPALLPPDECDAALRALADDLEGLDRGLRLEDALKQIAATTACHAAVKAQLSADAREDASHPRGAARHRLFDRVPARPAGDAAHHAAGNRKELRSDLER